MIIVLCSQLFGEVISLVNLHGGVISPVSIIALPIFLISSMALIKYLYIHIWVNCNKIDTKNVKKNQK